MEVWISKLLIKLGWCQYDACWKQSGRRGDEASPTPSVQNKSSLLPKSIVLSGLLARRWLSKASGNLPYILKLATQPFEKLREAWYNQFWTFDIDPSTTGTDSSTTCKRWPSFSGQQGWGLADWCCKYQCHVMMEVLASAFWKYIRSFLSCIYIYIYIAACACTVNVFVATCAVSGMVTNVGVQLSPRKFAGGLHSVLTADYGVFRKMAREQLQGSKYS